MTIILIREDDDDFFLKCDDGCGVDDGGDGDDDEADDDDDDDDDGDGDGYSGPPISYSGNPSAAYNQSGTNSSVSLVLPQMYANAPGTVASKYTPPLPLMF